MTQGLGWGGVVLLAGMAGSLTGCSTLGQADSTAAIAGPTATAAVGSTSGDAMAQGVQPAGVGKAITLADASCDQIKAEIATFDGDKIPQKLADFGKAKYHPTAEESIRFARYVDVEKASKDKNCSPAAKMQKKQVTAKASAPADPMAAAKKKVTTAVKPTATKPTTEAKAAVPAAGKVKKLIVPDPAAMQPVEDGVTVTVPDSSG